MACVADRAPRLHPGWAGKAGQASLGAFLLQCSISGALKLLEKEADGGGQACVAGVHCLGVAVWRGWSLGHC